MRDKLTKATKLYLDISDYTSKFNMLINFFVFLRELP